MNFWKEKNKDLNFSTISGINGSLRRWSIISAHKAVNHCTLYCNPSWIFGQTWKTFLNLTGSWFLLLPAAIVVGSAATRTLLLTWLLWRSLATVSSKSNHKNSKPTKALFGGERGAWGGWRGCRIGFSAEEFLLSGWFFLSSPLLLFHVNLACRLTKMFPSLFPQRRINFIHGE